MGEDDSTRARALRILRDEMGPCNDDVNHPPQAWEWAVDALIEAGLGLRDDEDDDG